MPQIRDFPAIYVAYVTEVGPYDEAIPHGFERLFNWLNANGIQPAGPSLGIFYDDPSKVEPQNRHCDLCAPVGLSVATPELPPSKESVGVVNTVAHQVRTKTIGGWRVASIIYQGQGSAARAYDEVYDWLRREGYKEDGAAVEIYLSRLGEELRAELCVPVVKNERARDSQGKQAMTPRKPASKTAKKATKRSTKKAVSVKPGR